MTTISTKDGIENDLRVCKDVLDALGVKWCIMGGIVLGYSRYREVMEWDTDVDIGIFEEVDTTSWDKIGRKLSAAGFSGIPSSRKDFILAYRQTELNLWMFHKNGLYYEAFPESTPGIKFVEKAIWYNSPKIVDFLGDKYPIPNNTEDYLVCQYGKDWKNNIVKDHEQYYLDKRGTRDVSKWPCGRATKHGDMWPKTLKTNDTMEGQ